MTPSTDATWMRLVALMDAEVDVGSRMAAMEGGYHGHEGIRRWWQDMLDASPDRTVEIVEVRDLGDVTLTEFHGRGHGAGERLSVRGDNLVGRPMAAAGSALLCASVR